MARFIDWLTTQQSRLDPIGRLSQAAVADRDFPRENDLGFILSYLTQRGANSQLLKTVRKAYSDFEKSIDDFRENVMGKPKEPEKPPKTKLAGTTTKKNSPATIEVKEKSAANNEKPEFVAVAKKTVRAKTATPVATIASATTKTIAAEPEKRRRVVTKKATGTETPEPVPVKASRATAPKTKAIPEIAAEKPAAQKKPVKTDLPPKAEKAKIPDRLAEPQQKLKDAVLLLDAQFGKGFAAQNPGLLVEYAKIMATNEQTGTIRKLLSSLAEAFLKIGSK